MRRTTKNKSNGNRWNANGKNYSSKAKWKLELQQHWLTELQTEALENARSKHDCRISIQRQIHPDEDLVILTAQAGFSRRRHATKQPEIASRQGPKG